MILVALVLAAVQPLHVIVTYGAGEVRSGPEVLARVLCTGVGGADESAMTPAQRQERTEALRRIDASWANEDRRGRARLVMALMRANGASPRALVSQTDCRFLFPEDKIVRADTVYLALNGSSAVVLEDVESGQYLAVVVLGEPSQLPELFHQLLANGGDAEKDPAAKEELVHRIREEAQRAEGKTFAVAEVNGRRDLLARGAGRGEIGQALARMWDNLGGQPRERLAWVLGVLAIVGVARSNSEQPGDWPVQLDVVAANLAYDGLPVARLPDGIGVRGTSPPGAGYPRLEPPPEEITKPFFGRSGWRVPDFSRSFPAQVRLLLRGDRP
jgi:hypothetical protein